MEEMTIMALFADGESARTAAHSLGGDELRATVSDHSADRREAGFMLRLVKWIVFWSIVGTGLGAVFGALLSYTVGPHGTEGFILLVVSWAIFAHLLIGMWAGYALLSDRSNAEMALSGATLMLPAERLEVAALTGRLRDAGATSVRVLSAAAAQPAMRR